MQSRSLFHAIATSEEEEKRFSTAKGAMMITQEKETHTHTHKKMVGERSPTSMLATYFLEVSQEKMTNERD